MVQPLVSLCCQSLQLGSEDHYELPFIDRQVELIELLILHLVDQQEPFLALLPPFQVVQVQALSQVHPLASLLLAYLVLFDLCA
jgi:hypothetical protein